MEIIAHRGAPYDAPENSLEAVELALVQRADRVEVDVHLSADGVVVVSHDETTGRCADRDIRIAGATLEELRTARLPNGERIPTLDEVCALLRGRAAIDLELKATGPEVVARALDVLARADLLDSALVTSFERPSIRAARRLGFGGRLGLLAGSKTMRIPDRAFETWPLPAMRRCGADALVIHHRLAHPLLRAALRRRGLPLYLWMSIEDELRPDEQRASWYRRIAAVEPAGAIVGRVAEARAAIAPPTTNTGANAPTTRRDT